MVAPMRKTMAANGEGMALVGLDRSGAGTSRSRPARQAPENGARMTFAKLCRPLPRLATVVSQRPQDSVSRSLNHPPDQQYQTRERAQYSEICRFLAATDAHSFSASWPRGQVRAVASARLLYA